MHAVHALHANAKPQTQTPPNKKAIDELRKMVQVMPLQEVTTIASKFLLTAVVHC
jgi:hypothetical protein